VIARPLSNGAAAVHLFGRNGLRDVHYNLAVVDADTWAAVDSSGERSMLATRGPTVPGTRHVRAADVNDDPSCLPDGYEGIPAGHDGSAVRWYEPPHPLALTVDECNAARECSVDLKDGGYAEMGNLPWENAPAVFAKVGAAALVANAYAWRQRCCLTYLTVLRYRTGSRFGWHHDRTSRAVREGVHLEYDDNLLSVIAQLSPSDDYDGGAVEFRTPEGPLTLPRTQGTVAVFPSTTWHRVTEVVSGTRYSMTSFLRAPEARP
jgi:hypothetical protein